MEKKHDYKVTIQWTGNLGSGTNNYAGYERSHQVLVSNKEMIACSSDPSFRGDKTKYNPEELFLSSISSCHMLWYLHLCSEKGIVVEAYTDFAEGTMMENSDGSGNFTHVTLHPMVVVADKAMIHQAIELHHTANKFCFIANSCNFTIYHKPICKIIDATK